ncbi:histidine phosphatase family protein [Methylophaga sp. OBS4]|uniref:histidine phosphatase family protein n=1 Tax=Methylophaga sp. OBS4 TaxID=2991935 RepID=UPI00224D18A3|nr:alpha-ribazole phosphatase family protein [Methylophaga sp. OBS4]MCX4188204.1 alpha-ribazole phosphatase family protein [Methylophaga sp. OBS4]
MIPTVIDLLRHGEPEGGHCYRGQIDDPLSALGWQQMRQIVPAELPWQQIVTSPLSRCAAFAEELTRSSGLPLTYEPRFMEIGFGEWEGKTATELEAADKQAFYAFYDDPLLNTPPGAEPLNEFQQRIVAAWRDLLNQYQQRHILLVAHAGTIRMILAHVLDIPLHAVFRIQVPYAGLSRISVSDAGARAYAQLQFHAGRL